MTCSDGELLLSCGQAGCLVRCRSTARHPFWVPTSPHQSARSGSSTPLRPFLLQPCHAAKELTHLPTATRGQARSHETIAEAKRHSEVPP